MIACDFSRHACYILSWFPFFCVYLSPLPCPSSPFPFPQFSPLHPAISLSIAPPTPYPGGGSILLSWFLSYTRICTPLLKTGSWQPQRARTTWVRLSGAPWPHSTWSFLVLSLYLQISLFSTAAWKSRVYMFISLVLHLSVEGLLGRFHLLALVKRAAMNTAEQVPMEWGTEPFGRMPKHGMKGSSMDSVLAQNSAQGFL